MYFEVLSPVIISMHYTQQVVRQTEKARHLLAVREKLKDLRRASTRDLSKPDKDENNEMRRRSSSRDDTDDDDDDVRVTSDASPIALSSDRQQQLVVKCVKLLTQKHFLEVATNAQVRRLHTC